MAPPALVLGRRRWREGAITTMPAAERQPQPQPDWVERDSTTKTPDQLYVADTTYVPTWADFLSLAIVVDVRSRRVVG